MSLFVGSTRSKFESAAYTVLFLAFFFAVGLAGGVLYRVLPTHKALDSEASSAPVTAPMAEAPAPTAPAPAPVTSAKTPAPAVPVARETAPAVVAAAPAPSAPAPAPVATLPPPLAVAPVAASPGEAPAPPAKPVATERVTKSAPPPERAVKEAAPAKAAKAALAPKPKPAAVAAAQPSKPVPAKPALPAASRAEGTPETGPFRIQFGAFTIEENAQHTLWDVEATGMPVEIVHAPSHKGHMLYYVRSQPFPDRDAALKAATTAREKGKKFAHPVTIDYVVVSDAMIASMQSAAPKP